MSLAFASLLVFLGVVVVSHELIALESLDGPEPKAWWE